MSKIMVWCRDHSWIVILLTLLFTAFFAYKAKDIRIDVSAEGMMIEGDPDMAFYDETLDIFGTDNITVIYIKDENLFTTGTLEAIRDVVYALEELPNVDRVESLYTSTNFNGKSGSLETLPILDWIPEEPDELADARTDAMRSPLLYGSLISKDGKAMVLNVLVTPDKSDPDFNIKISNAIDEIIAPLKNVVDEVFQVGKPYTRKTLGDSIMGDMTSLIPLSVCVLLIVLVLGLRSINGAIIPLLTGGLSILWTFGFMSLTGIPINVVTVIVPSLLLVIGATEDMHIISEYLEGLHSGEDRLGAIRYLASKVGLAIFLTSLTTFLGFFSIVVNKITLLRQFGIAASFGLGVNFLITFSITPVYLKYFGGKRGSGKNHKEKEADTEKNPEENIFQLVADHILRVISANKKLFLWGMIIAALIIGTGVARIKVDNDFLGYFKKDSTIRVRSDILHKEVSGTQNFYIVLDAHAPDAFRDPENLKKIFAIQRYMDKTGEWDKTLSLADYVALVNREMEQGREEAFIIPDSADLIAQYLLLFSRHDIDRYVSPDFSKANITVRHNMSSSYELKKALTQLRPFMEKILGKKIDFRFTGENILINKAADTMAVGQALSLSLILGIILIIMTILFLRVKAGLLSLIPNMFPIAIIFGIMGYLDIPLNTGTAMIAAIAIGIAVDDTIHLMVRYNNEMKQWNDQEKAMIGSVKGEIQPVLSTSVALALGFIVLVASNFNPIVHFGGLSAIVMILAVSGDLFLTPILLSKTKLITLWDMISLDLKARVINESLLFVNMRPWEIKKVVLLGHIKEYHEGETIIRKGEKGKSLFLILDGTASVVGEDDNGMSVVLQELQPGDIVGEIALVTELERTAYVYANQYAKALEIDWTSLDRIRRFFPTISSKLFLNMAQILGFRLADTSERLVCEIGLRNR